MKRALSIAFVLLLTAGMAWAAQAPQTAPAGQQPAPAQGAAGGQAGRGGGGGRGAITPRILSFQATPASIKPGESFMLSWATEAGTATVDNGIGSITPRGTMK